MGKESEGGERPGEVEEGELEIIVGGELRNRWKVMGEKQRVESGGYFSLGPGGLRRSIGEGWGGSLPRSLSLYRQVGEGMSSLPYT